MKSLATVATLAIAAFALQPALAQDTKKAGEEGKETVAGLPILPTDSIQDLFKMREQWGTKPTMSTAEPGKSEMKMKK